SNDPNWRAAVERSRRQVTCPMCRGSGLGPAALLLKLGSRTLEEWVREGCVAEFMKAFEAVRTLRPRAAKERKRVSHCLEPLRHSRASLREEAPPAVVPDVLGRAAETFAGLGLVRD